MRRCGFVLLAAFPLFPTGCGGGPKFVPVSGRVTMDGKPLANVNVSFQPMAKGNNLNPGGGSYAVTDADGRYTLKSVESDQDGAVVGSHRIMIQSGASAADADTGQPRVEVAPRANRVVVPTKYNSQTTLTFDVPAGGTKDANFELVSK